jgi:predicted MPP superfamily phosphohydrolase
LRKLRTIGLTGVLAASVIGPGFTGPEAAPRILRGPYLQAAPFGSTTVVWYTDVPADGAVQWREQGGSWFDVAQDGPPSLRHEVVLRGVQAGAPYAYRILGAGAVLSNVTTQTDFDFLAPPVESLRFLAFGDSGSGSAAQMALARKMIEQQPPPDLVLLTGDLIYPNGADADYDRKFFAPYGPLLARVPFFAAIGNHDYETDFGRPYLAVFSLFRNGPPDLVPETVYSFEQAGVHFNIHDSNLSAGRLRQFAAPWHVADVRASTARFRIASMHHPPYSSGPNSLRAPTPTVREVLPPLFSNTGIDLVLTGHDHLYERTRPIGGVVYVTTGAGGHSLYPRVATNDFTEVFYGEGGRDSFTTVEVSGRFLKLQQTDVAGCRVDGLLLDKAVAEADPWRIFKGTSSPPLDWTSTSFRDGDWTVARGAVGHGNAADVTTPLTDMPGAYLTVYGRYAFFQGAAATPNDLILRVRYEGGVVATLNGIEIARRNVPAGQDHRTPASAVHSGEWFETIQLPPSLVQSGLNVLAVEGHNSALNRPTFVLAAELTQLTGAPGRCP